MLEFFRWLLVASLIISVLVVLLAAFVCWVGRIENGADDEETH